MYNNTSLLYFFKNGFFSSSLIVVLLLGHSVSQLSQATTLLFITITITIWDEKVSMWEVKEWLYHKKVYILYIFVHNKNFDWHRLRCKKSFSYRMLYIDIQNSKIFKLRSVLTIYFLCINLYPVYRDSKR